MGSTWKTSWKMFKNRRKNTKSNQSKIYLFSAIKLKIYLKINPNSNSRSQQLWRTSINLREFKHQLKKDPSIFIWRTDNFHIKILTPETLTSSKDNSQISSANFRNKFWILLIPLRTMKIEWNHKNLQWRTPKVI